MQLTERINAFVALGQKIRDLSPAERQQVCLTAYHHHTWFTENNVLKSLEGLAYFLEKENINNWISAYAISDNVSPRKIAVVMAGNIPLVGVHDLICVLISGHILWAKPSKQDSVLIKQVARWLVEIEPRFADRIEWIEQVKGADALIATGTDNTARHFDYYFSKYPRIIRRNRNSCAVLNGKESPEVLAALAEDILLYFGLGCRSVAKLYLPTGADLFPVLQALEPMGREVVSSHKYANNYDYNKSIFLINQVPHFDNGYVMLRENEALASPISVVHYEYYHDEAELAQKLDSVADQIQCIASANAWWPGSVPIGQTQMPSLSDYADGVDTMRFLIDLTA